MRLFTISALVFTLFAASAAIAQDDPLIPERRMAVTQNVDLPGNDLRQVFDVPIDACLKNCLADSTCNAVTYNAHASACFPKGSAGEAAPFQGAYSGRVITAQPGAQELAHRRAEAAPFLRDEELQRAYEQAQRMSDYLTGGLDAATLSQAARDALANGATAEAQQLMGASVSLEDRPEDWGGFAELMLSLGAEGGDRGGAQLAAINAYLRSGSDATAAEALFLLARIWEDDSRGRDTLSALRLASTLDTREDIAVALADAEGKYGFRITDQLVESDKAAPRICAVFSEELQDSVDYTPYIALPKTGLSVQAEGNQLCIAGLDHGARYALTFRQGLPAANGDSLPRNIEMAQYVRDRAAMVRFDGRNYVLPRMADAGLPVVTVNTDALDLRLIRVSDRNLVQTLRDGYMARQLDYWSEEALTDRMGEVVWQGQADVGRELNAEVTTRLPIQEVTGPLGAGIYALQAQVPDTSAEEIAPATQWFVISDLGISALQGVDGLHVVVRGLTDTAARAGARVALLSRGNEVLAEAQTDDQGIATFDAALTGGQGNAAPAAITVADGDDMAFLPLTDPEFDLSDRGVEGLPPAPPVDVFLTTDRGAYRAGETIRSTILARNGADQRAISGLPLTAVLTRPDGVELTRQIAPEAGAGGHTADFAIPVTAPRGTWRVDVLADPDAPALASAKVLVEDFLPERLDFTPQMPEGVLAMDALPEISVDVRYLFGAPGAGLEVEGETRLSAADSLPAHEGYHFGRFDDSFPPLSEPLVPGTTDDQGHLTLTATLPESGAQAGRPLKADFVISVREGSGRPVERVVTRTVLPNQPVAGIRPLFDGDAVADGAEAGFSVIAIGSDSQQVATGAAWVVNRIETDYQWYSIGGRWDYEMITRRSKVDEGRLDLTADAPAELSLPVAWGRYEVVVTPDGGGAASYGFDSGWYTVAGSLQTPDRLSVALDKPRYSAGETAVALIDAPAAGTAVISVLTNRVVDLKLVPLVKGENRIDLPVTDAWGTGAYVTASAIRPVGADDGHAPIRALGLAHAGIEPGDRALTTAIEAPAEADPRGTLPVTLRVQGAAPGDQVYATLAAVDLGILNLTGFTSPDPSAHYFGQRRLGVAIRDLYGRLIDGQAGAQGAIRSGGDAMVQLSMQAPPKDDLLAWFSGPVTLAEDGTATLDIPLPAFNGTVRLMAVTWSDKGVGQAQQDVLVRDPVVLTASAPRFLAPGDQAQVLLELTHASGPSGQMGLAASSQGLTLGTLPAAVTLADQGTERLTLPITAPDAEGATELALSVTTPDGRVLEQQVTIPVVANGARVSHESRFTLAAGDDLTLPADLLENMVAGTASATLALGPAARFDAAQILRGLADYPYGCTEQITSQAMPLLAFSQAAEGMPDADRAGERIDQAIQRVLTRQDSGGGFGLWSADGGDDWLNAYVTDFLSRARAAGHAVPDQAFRMALDRLRNSVNYAADFDAESNGGGEALAYALFVLAREGAVPVGDLRYYADEKGGDFGTPLAAAQVGAALASYGDQRRADAMFTHAAERMKPTGDETYVFRTDYGTRLRDLAGVLTLASAAGSQVLSLDDLGASLQASLNGQSLSPQESVWSLMAAGQLTSANAPGEGFTLNGQPLGTALIRDVTADGGASVHNGSGREELVTLTVTGLPATPEPAGGKGYTLTREYFTHEGAPVDPASVAQGTRLVAVLTVTPHQEGGGRLIVDDPLPAGFEIENPHLLRLGDNAALDWLQALDEVANAEFRDDRFVAAVDWTSADAFRLAYTVRAITPGGFAHPAASVMDMYRPDWRAWTDSGRVAVTE